jgi:Ino eighty subunit 1
MSSRKLVPIKRGQGEPLTRADLQHDLLRRIFSDTHPVFTDPWPHSARSVAPKLTFRQVYIKALLNSTKTTKAFRDKLAESDTFAEDFAMIALLVNVGRINTTMSCQSLLKSGYTGYASNTTISLS